MEQPLGGRGKALGVGRTPPPSWFDSRTATRTGGGAEEEATDQTRQISWQKLSRAPAVLGCFFFSFL